MLKTLFWRTEAKWHNKIRKLPKGKFSVPQRSTLLRTPLSDSGWKNRGNSYDTSPLNKLPYLTAFAVLSLPEANVVSIYLATLNKFFFCEPVPPALKPLADKASQFPLLSHIWSEEPPSVCLKHNSCPLQLLIVPCIRINTDETVLLPEPFRIFVLRSRISSKETICHSPMPLITCHIPYTKL